MKGGRGELGLAIGVIALGACLLLGARGIDASAGYDRVGPRVFPYAVGAGLMLLGVLLAAAPSRTESVPHTDWTPIGYLGLAFLLFLVLVERTGFVAAASVQFWLVARAFRSRRPARDAAVAVLLAAVVFIAFSRGLGLRLPRGPFERLF